MADDFNFIGLEASDGDRGFAVTEVNEGYGAGFFLREVFPLEEAIIECDRSALVNYPWAG